MAQGERQIGEGRDKFLTPDVLGDILARVDGATLARLSSVSTQFRSAALDEALWENLCNQRWPSTKQLPVKTLISSAGGFRKLYSNCFPFVSPRHGREYHEESASAADFVSIVDVTYNGDSVLSRVVDGIPGAGDRCGPLVDILEATREDNHGMAINSEEEEDWPVVSILTTMIPRAQERRDGHRFWLTLCKQMCVSWILIHKKTQRMVNIASWKPLSGVRHRPCGDDDFLLRFGSILPNPNSTPVHCNITMRCRASEFEEGVLHPETPALTVVKITELGITLEDIYAVHRLRGQEAVNLLFRAMTCDRTVNDSKVSSIYHKFVATQMSNREALIRRENHRQTAGAVFFVGTIVIGLMAFCYKPSC